MGARNRGKEAKAGRETVFRCNERAPLLRAAWVAWKCLEQRIRNSSLGQVRRLDYLNSRNSFPSRFTGHPRRVTPKRYIHSLRSCGGGHHRFILAVDIRAIRFHNVFSTCFVFEIIRLVETTPGRKFQPLQLSCKSFDQRASIVLLCGVRI